MSETEPISGATRAGSRLPSPYYEDDSVTIYHADSREILPYIRDDAAALVTDPPYGIDWNLPAYNGARAHAGIQNDATTDARDHILDAWGDGPAVVFGSPILPLPTGTKQTLVWKKSPDSGIFGSIGGFRRDWEAVYLLGSWPKGPAQRSGVIETTQGMGSYLNGPPHAKPIGLMIALIEACPPGLIVDPFMGSGSTLAAAKQCGRKAVGIEIDEGHCRLAAERCGQGVLALA